MNVCNCFSIINAGYKYRFDSMTIRDNYIPEKVYTATPSGFNLKQLLVEISREFIDSHGLAWRLFVRNLNIMYRQTYFGYVWAIAPPLMTAIIFIFLRSQSLIDVEIKDYPYSIYVITGVLLWQSFVEAINSPLKMLNSAASYIGKINFPKVALLTAGFGEVVFNSIIRGMILIVFYSVSGTEFGKYALMVPVCYFSLILLGFAMGILISPIGLLFKDVEKGMAIITYAWFFLTPVFYALPENINLFYIYLNPVTPMLITIRELLHGDELLYLNVYVLYSLLSLFALLPGLIVYRLSMPFLIERVEA